MIFWLLPVFAQDDWGDDDAGFADFEVEEPTEKRSSPLQAGGSLQTTESIWIERLDDYPLAKARQSLDLFVRYKRGWFRAELSGHGELDLPYLINPERFDAQTRHDYGWQLLLREAYVAASVGDFEFTVGRQKIAWGEGMLFSPVDVVAPRDLRHPGLADLEDLRLPVTGFRIGWFPGAHRFELFGVIESSWGFRSPPQGPYGMIDAALDPVLANPLYGPLFEDVHFEWDHQGERFDLSEPQLYARWRTSVEGFDLGLYAASLLDKTGTIGFPELSAIVEGGTVGIPVNHRRYTMFGHSGATSFGVLLLRWEASLELNRAVSAGDVQALPPELAEVRTNIVRCMGGAQYAGIKNLTIDVEVSGGSELQPTPDLLFPVAPFSYASRLSYTALRERLQLSATGIGFGVGFELGGMVRVDATYEIIGGVHAQIGGITYHPGTKLGPLAGLDSHDQVFGQVRWDF